MRRHKFYLKNIDPSLNAPFICEARFWPRTPDNRTRVMLEVLEPAAFAEQEQHDQG
jgi:hypothetical protein